MNIFGKFNKFISLFGMSVDYIDLDTSKELDKRALASDWAIVGNDLRAAMNIEGSFYSDPDITGLSLFKSGINMRGSNDMYTRTEVGSRDGILPPADQLASYESIVKGSAASIMRAFLKQSSHRMQMEALRLEAEINRSRLGITYALISTLVSLTCCVILVIKGFTLAGGATGLFGSSAVAAFIYGTRLCRPEQCHKGKDNGSETPPED
jgi:uncharacterized membrane protein